MNTSTKTLLGAAAAIALAASAAASVAQDQPAGPPPGGFQGRGGPPPSPEMREQMMTQRLGLRADQAPALQAFLAATGPQAGRGERREMRNMTTPQRLDMQLAEMKTRADATKKFYAQLTPEQRATFDAMPMPMMGGMEGRGGRGGPGGPGGRRGGPNQGFGAPPAQ